MLDASTDHGIPRWAEPLKGRMGEIRTIVRDVVRERLSAEVIREVVVQPDVDVDDDPILRILVVLKAASVDQLDSGRMVGLVRHLRARLESERLDAFPMISYVSSNEAGRLLDAD